MILNQEYSMILIVQILMKELNILMDGLLLIIKEKISKFNCIVHLLMNIF
jgi:hypothetical protein